MSGVEVILDAAITCGESPVWVAAEEAVYFTDIPGRRMHRLVPGSGAHRTWEMPEELCCFAPRDAGGFVAGMRSGFALLAADSLAVEYLARPEVDKPDNRLNDGRCDRQGRFWAGSMHEPRSRLDGVLYRLGTDRQCTAMAGGVMVANGLAWSPDGHTMYWSDSRKHTIFAFDFDPDTGSLDNRRVFFRTSEAQGRPDGAAVDAEGCYWSACFLGGCVLCITPDGRVEREIPLPVRDVTMVCFGGPALDTLYITTSREALTEEQRRRSPLAGSVFVADPAARGLAEPHYLG